MVGGIELRIPILGDYAVLADSRGQRARRALGELSVLRVSTP